MRFPGHGVFLLAVLAFPAEADIYRCGGTFGEPLFRQQPCGDNTTAAVAGTAGGVGRGVRDSERRWLEGRASAARDAGSGNRRAKAAPASTAGAANRQAYRCLRQRRGLDAVKAEMRRGYKPSKGEKLRRRRRAYEDYLDAFCP